MSIGGVGGTVGGGLPSGYLRSEGAYPNSWPAESVVQCKGLRINLGSAGNLVVPEHLAPSLIMLGVFRAVCTQ